MKCRLCNRTLFECGGYLERVNEKGVPGVWECRPTCGAKLTNEQAVLAALKGPTCAYCHKEIISGEFCAACFEKYQ